MIVNKNELETIVESEWLKRQASGLLRTIPQLASSGVQLGKDVVDTAVDTTKAVVGAGKDVVDTVKDVATGETDLSGVGTGMKNFAGNLATGVKDAVTDYIPDKIDQVATGVQDTISGVGNTIDSAVKGDALIAPSTFARPLGHDTWDGSDEDTVTGNAIDVADKGLSTYANVASTPATIGTDIATNAVTNAATKTISNPNTKDSEETLEEDELPSFRKFFNDRS